MRVDTSVGSSANSDEPAPCAVAGRIGRLLCSPFVAATVLFLIALIPRVHFYVSSGPYGMVHVTKDSKLYLTLASTLWSHGQFAETPGEPHCVVVPAYPLFLAPFVGLFGLPPREGLYVQVILGAMLPFLCYWIARRLKGNLAGWLAGLFAAAYLPPAAFASRFLTENLAIPLFLLSFLLVDMLLERRTAKTEWGLAIAIGGLFALQSLNRSVCLPLIAVPIGFYVLAGRKEPKRMVTNAVLACLAFVVVYSPWVIRNRAVFGEVIITSRTEKNLIRQQQAGYALNLKTSTLDEARALGKKLGEEYRKRGERPPLPEFDAQLYVRQSLLRFGIMLGAHPSLELPFPFSGRHFGQSRIVRWENYIWTALMFACVLVAILLALAKRDLRVFHAIALPFGLIGGYSLVHAIPRYQMVPYMGLTVAAGIGLAALLAAFSRMTQRVRSAVASGGSPQRRDDLAITV